LPKLAPSGFTLVELLIVLAIMAAVTALFLPRLLTGTAGAELREATHEMTAALAETRSLAIARNRVASVVIDPATRRYREPGREHHISDRVSIAWHNVAAAGNDGDQVAIYFFPDGSSSGGEIDFAAGIARAAVTIDWFTGRAAAHEMAAARR
jgi:general secretion pathway protein H